jgi:hypothetical protein
VPPARNAPCPCGSGRKYKHCCLPKDEARRAHLRLVPDADRVAERLRPGEIAPPPGEPWDVDLVPLPTTIDDEPDARLCALLVAAGEVIVHLDTIVHPPADPQAVAVLIEGGIRAVRERHGGIPTAVRVRFATLAAALRHEPALAGVPITTAHDLPALDPAARFLLEQFGSAAHANLITSGSPTWRGWDLGDAATADLFAAAAEFYRAAPWRHVLNEQTLAATTAHATWTTVVLGNAGREFGLALYAHPDDFARQLEAEGPGFPRFADAVLAVVFCRRDEVPRAARREARAAGWEMAGPDAYPTLFVVNTPGGGVTREQAADLTTLLRAVPRAVARFEPALTARIAPERPLEWTDAESGVRFAYDGGWLSLPEGLWPAPTTLAPALPSGTGADPAAALRDDPPEALERDHAKLLDRFARRRAADRRSDAVRQRDADCARALLEFLADWQGVPVAACTEYDLRLFLYDWFHRKTRVPAATARALPTALGRFLAFLAAEEGIECPWAAAVLAERDRYEERRRSFPGGFWWDAAVQDWQAVAHEDLDARVLLHDSDLGAGDRWGDTMGEVEARLAHELQRRWLLWRDEVIAAGTTDPATVRAALVRRQRAWETAPHPRHGGATPAAVVARERRERAPVATP